MEFAIPAVPTALLLVLQFLSPYVVSGLSNFDWTARTKKIVATVISFILSAALLAVALSVGWIPQDFTPLGLVTLVLLGLGTQQVAYGMFLKESADTVMRTRGLYSKGS